MKLKNIIIGMLSTSIIFTTSVPFASYAYDKSDLPDIGDINIDFDPDKVKEASYEFTLKSDGTYEISKFIYDSSTVYPFSPSPDLEIPSTYKDKPITSIGKSAFCTNNADHLTGCITIPDTVTSIGASAFYLGEFTNCVIPSSVTSIGVNAFRNTPYLDNMRAKNPLFIVNNILVDAQTAKGAVIVPNGVTEICGYAFYENADVTSVTLPDSVKSIGENAFDGCEALTKINLPDGLVQLGDSAFQQCRSLSGTLKIPNGIKNIDSFTFNSCVNLSGITLPDGLTEIGNNAFRNCQNITSLTIPNTVKTIGIGAFSEMRTLESLIVPASVTSIGNYCFDYTYCLDSLTILNPNCAIYDDKTTVYGRTTIYGYSGSTAQAYAEKYGKYFSALDQSQIKLGDVDFSGDISPLDSSITLSAYAMLSTTGNSGLNAAQTTAADVDRSGYIDPGDASYILSYYAYLATGGTESIEKFIG